MRPPARSSTASSRTRLIKHPSATEIVIVGFVTRASAEASDPDTPIQIQRLTSPCLVNADAAVGILLRRLTGVSMVFAVRDTGLAGFVTPSDLNKHPVRAHFYLLLADLEMTMAAEGRGRLQPDVDQALETLSPGRRAKVEDRHADAKSINLDADVLTAFEFVDLLTMVQKTGLHKRFGHHTPTSWRSATKGLPDFRDHVMHPTSDFLGRRTIADLVAIEEKLRGTLLAVAA